MKPYKNVTRSGATYSEHKWIWEQEHGPVPPGYVVHHINHNKRDNRLENLRLMTHEEHSRHHNDKHARVKTCVICKAEYTPHATKRERQQTCSAKCRRALLAAKATARYGGPYYVTCERCSTRKRIPAGRVGKARFCSLPCANRRSS